MSNEKKLAESAEPVVEDLEIDVEESDGVKGGFNPQPEPPGRH